MQLPENPRVCEALGYAMKRLAQRDRLSSELSGELGAKGYGEAEVAEVLEFLTSRRLLDDEKTIQSLIERRTGRRAAGKEKIRAELQKLGVPEEKIEQNLSAVGDDDELERMRQALNSRSWPDGARPRAARFLMSRGFSEELLETALDRFFGAE